MNLFTNGVLLNTLCLAPTLIKEIISFLKALILRSDHEWLIKADRSNQAKSCKHSIVGVLFPGLALGHSSLYNVIYVSYCISLYIIVYVYHIYVYHIIYVILLVTVLFPARPYSRSTGSFPFRVGPGTPLKCNSPSFLVLPSSFIKKVAIKR